MKKRTALFLTAIIILSSPALFSSCGGKEVTAEIAPSELLGAIVEAYDPADVPEALLFLSGAPGESEEYLDPDRAGYLFYSEYGCETPPLYELPGFALRIPTGNRVFEVDILLAADRAQLDGAKELLRARLGCKSSGDVANYMPEEQRFLDAAEIFTVGNYAFLIATVDNGIARGVIKTKLAADSGSVSAPPISTSETVVTAPPTVKNDVIEMQSFVNIQLSASKSSPDIPQNSAERTLAPKIAIAKHSENTRIFITGTCSPGAKVYIRGGLENKAYTPDYGYYMGDADIPAEGVTVITVTAKEEGKAESLPVTLTVRAREDVRISQKMNNYTVIVGDKYQEYVKDMVADFVGSNLLSDAQISALSGRIKDKTDFLKGVNPNAEIIYLLVPTSMTVYPEGVPKSYVQNTGTSLTEQFTSAAESAGAVVLDLTGLFIEHRDDEFKVFHKTDTHWTDYGVYLGYKTLTEYISAAWPDAAPRPESDFEFYHKLTGAGDLPPHLDIEKGYMFEYATFGRFNFTPPTNAEIFVGDSNLLFHTNTQNGHTVNNPTDKKLPKAMIIRDSFGTPAYDLFNDAFASVYWQKLWDYGFNKNSISDYKPDYFIYLITERNIKSIMG